MAFSEEQLTELERTIASGAKETRFQDRTLVQQELNELLRLRGIIKGELEAGTSPDGVTPRRRMILVAGGSGL